MRTHTRTFAVIAVLASVFAAACSSGSGTESPSDQPPIRIAVEGPMTGEQSATGLDIWWGASLAIQEANAAGGVLGRKIVPIMADDAADAAKGVQLAERYAARSFAVIGPYNSSVGIENLPKWIDGGAIPIHLTSNVATDGMGYTIQPKDYQVAPVEVDAMTGLLDVTKVAIVYDTSTYTSGIAQQVKDGLEAKDVEVTVFKGFDGTKMTEAKATALYAKIAQSDSDMFYASTYYPQGALLADAAAAATAADAPKCFMGLANQDTAFVTESGVAAAQACTFSGVPTPPLFPNTENYINDYEAQWDTAPGTWGIFAYDSVKMLFAAVEKAGSWNKQDVAGELSATMGYEGLTGLIDIDPDTGNRTNVPVVILGIDDQGEFLIDPAWAEFSGFGS